MLTRVCDVCHGPLDETHVEPVIKKRTSIQIIALAGANGEREIPVGKARITGVEKVDICKSCRDDTYFEIREIPRQPREEKPGTGVTFETPEPEKKGKAKSGKK